MLPLLELWLLPPPSRTRVPSGPGRRPQAACDRHQEADVHRLACGNAHAPERERDAAAVYDEEDGPLSTIGKVAVHPQSEERARVAADAAQLKEEPTQVAAEAARLKAKREIIERLREGRTRVKAGAVQVKEERRNVGGEIAPMRR